MKRTVQAMVSPDRFALRSSGSGWQFVQADGARGRQVVHGSAAKHPSPCTTMRRFTTSWDSVGVVWTGKTWNTALHLPVGFAALR